MKKLKVVTVVVFVVAGCATLPPAPRVSSFGDAVATTASAVQGAFKANDELNSKIQQEYRATALLQHTKYQPPKELEFDRAAVAVRLKALAALQGYGKALAAAADQGSIEQLQKASDELSTSIGNLAATVIPSTAPIVGPAVKFASRTFGILASNRYAAEIQSIIVKTNPDIQLLASELEAELPRISVGLQAQAARYAVQRDLNLKLIAGDPRVDSLRLYGESRVSTAEIADADTIASLSDKAIPTLKALAKAHDDLAKGSFDSAVVLGQFIILANELAPLIDAIQRDGK